MSAGYQWGAFATLQTAVTLTTGGAVINNSDPVDLDGVAACEVAVDAAYSDHAKDTAGLRVRVLRSYDGTNYQDEDDLPYAVELPFTQDGANRMVFSVDPSQVGSFRLQLDWGNEEAGSHVTVTTRFRTATLGD